MTDWLWPLSSARRVSAADVDVVVGLDQLAGSWDKLSSVNATPMQRLAWTRAAQQAEGPNCSIVNFVLGDRYDPQAIASFRCISRRPMELVLTAYPARCPEPLDFLFRDRASLARLCDVLVELRLPLKIRRVFSASPTALELARACAGKGVTLRRSMPSCPAIELDTSWLEPERKFNSGRRSDLRRARRRAEAIGSVTFDLLAPQPSENEPLLQEAFNVETEGWKGRSGTALAVNQREGEFFRRWVPLAAEDGSLRMAFMRLDGQPIAMHIAAEVDRRLWLLKIGYDERVARCSPGTQLMLEVVKAAAERALTHVEFLGQSETWTSLWCGQARPCAGLATYPFSLMSAPTLTRDVVSFARTRLRSPGSSGHLPAPSGVSAWRLVRESRAREELALEENRGSA